MICFILKYTNQSLRKLKIHQSIYSLLTKGLDFIHTNKLLRNEEVTSTLANILQNDEALSVVYSCDSAALNTMLSYKDFNDLGTFITGLIVCNCESPFMRRTCGHIFIRDARCIKNKHLKKLITKGPNFRESRTINFVLDLS